MASRATSGSRTKCRVRVAGSSHKPKSWTFFPWLTSWAALWRSLLLVRHRQPWTPRGALTSCPDTPKPKTGLSLGRTLFLRDTPQVWALNCGCSPQFSFFSPLAPAWCLRSEGVSSVLLGVSSAAQLLEHLGALQVSWGLRAIPSCPTRNGLGRSATAESSHSAEERSRGDKGRLFSRHLAPLRCSPPWPPNPMPFLGEPARPVPSTTAFPARC